VIGATNRFTKVNRSNRYLGRHMPAVVAKVAARFVDTAIACLDFVRRIRNTARLEWREINASDPALTGIWQDHPAHLLLAQRTPDVLNWRYTINTASIPWSIWLACDVQGSPQGYVVWRQNDGIAEVSDFYCRAPESGTRELLVSFCWSMRSYPSISAVSVAFFGSGVVTELIRSAGFWPGHGGQPIVVRAAKPEDVPPPSAWYFTHFDVDAD
jgi:hypothetical protein